MSRFDVGRESSPERGLTEVYRATILPAHDSLPPPQKMAAVMADGAKREEL